jgi:hypothetical protein
MPTFSKPKAIRATAKSRPKVENIDFGEIDKITVELNKTLKAEIGKGSVGLGRREFGFSVVIDGGQIRLQPAPSGARAGQSRFDPGEAGRKLAAQMQDAEGGAWTGAELLRTFKLTSANLHKRRSEYRMIAWRDATHQFHYPKWQFTQAGALLPGVQSVLQIFRSSDEWRVMRYFLTAWRQLEDQRPLDLLRAGEVDRVVAHAKANGEENSW